jgi:glyoxylase I family protein
MVQLHHVALGAEDVRLVADFYARAFELTYAREHFYDDGRLRSIWLRTGDSLLMIEHTPSEATEATARSVTGIGRGAFLLAFSISKTEEQTAVERLISLGSVIESRTEHSVYARDPEGNRIAISHYPID